MKGGLNVIQVISLDIASAILMGYMLYTLPVCRLSDIFLGVGGILFIWFFVGLCSNTNRGAE